MSNLFIQFIAVMTVVSSIAIKIIGYPDQIRKRIKTKRVDNISILNYWLTVITYIFWTIHGIIKHDLVIILAQSLGILTSGILLMVTLRYKQRAKYNS